MAVDAAALGATAATAAPMTCVALTGAARRPSCTARRREPGTSSLDLRADDDDARRRGLPLDRRRDRRHLGERAAGAFYGTRYAAAAPRPGRRPSPPASPATGPAIPSEASWSTSVVSTSASSGSPAHIEILGWLKLNYLHLHFTENLGWRIESDGHPEVVSEEHLTKQQVRDLFDLAAAQPRHRRPRGRRPRAHGRRAAQPSRAAAARRPGHARTPTASTSRCPRPASSRSSSSTSTSSCSPVPYWHTGADEFLVTVPPLATPVDYALYPQLEAYARERARARRHRQGRDPRLRQRHQRPRQGPRARRCGSGTTASPAANVVDARPRRHRRVVDRPRRPRTPAELLAAGHRISNMQLVPDLLHQRRPRAGSSPAGPTTSRSPTSRVTRTSTTAGSPTASTARCVHNGVTFTPAHVVASRRDQRNLGAKIAIWNDDPTVATEEETAPASLLACDPWPRRPGGRRCSRRPTPSSRTSSTASAGRRAAPRRQVVCRGGRGEDELVERTRLHCPRRAHRCRSGRRRRCSEAPWPCGPEPPTDEVAEAGGRDRCDRSRGSAASGPTAVVAPVRTRRRAVEDRGPQARSTSATASSSTATTSTTTTVRR